MTPQAAPSQKQAETGLQTLGVVSFLNALPLYESLLGRGDTEIRPAVPSQLRAMLDQHLCDAAMLPIVDHWDAREKLELISDACIASDGETTTVRVFSSVPPDRVRRLAVDGDSRTSVVLARLVWLELYGQRLHIEPWCPGQEDPKGQEGDAQSDAKAVLLIGDKVIRQGPRGFGFEVDLGAAWKHITGLPFVFAAWYAARGPEHGALVDALQAARDAGVADVERIARTSARRHGWSEAVALEYLRDVMRYTLTPAMRTAMERFADLAVRHDLLT